MRISTIVMTLNEIDNIGPCMESVKDLGGEVLVIDESDDGTGALAASLGARVLRPGLSGGISVLRNYSLEHAEGDYVFFLDADERVSPGLAKEINAFLDSGRKEALAMRRHNTAFGQRVRFGPLYPDWVTRIFPKNGVNWKGLVHERPETGLPVRRLKSPLAHYTYKTFRMYLAKQERYARLWAEDAERLGKAATPWKAVSHAFTSFLKMLFLKLGILGGPVCWALCWYYAGAYTLGKYLLLADRTMKLGGTGKDEKNAQEPPKAGP